MADFAFGFDAMPDHPSEMPHIAPSDGDGIAGLRLFQDRVFETNQVTTASLDEGNGHIDHDLIYQPPTSAAESSNDLAHPHKSSAGACYITGSPHGPSNSFASATAGDSRLADSSKPQSSARTTPASSATVHKPHSVYAAFWSQRIKTCVFQNGMHFVEGTYFELFCAHAELQDMISGQFDAWIQKSLRPTQPQRTEVGTQDTLQDVANGQIETATAGMDKTAVASSSSVLRNASTTDGPTGPSPFAPKEDTTSAKSDFAPLLPHNVQSSSSFKLNSSTKATNIPSGHAQSITSGTTPAHCEYPDPASCTKLSIDDDDWMHVEQHIAATAKRFFNAMLKPFDPSPEKLKPDKQDYYEKGQKDAMTFIHKRLATTSQQQKVHNACRKLAHTVVCINKFGISTSTYDEYELAMGEDKTPDRRNHVDECKCSDRRDAVLDAITSNKLIAKDVVKGHSDMFERLARDAQWELETKVDHTNINERRSVVNKKAKELRNEDQKIKLESEDDESVVVRTKKPKRKPTQKITPRPDVQASEALAAASMQNPVVLGPDATGLCAPKPLIPSAQAHPAHAPSALKTNDQTFDDGFWTWPIQDDLSPEFYAQRDLSASAYGQSSYDQPSLQHPLYEPTSYNPPPTNPTAYGTPVNGQSAYGPSTTYQPPFDPSSLHYPHPAAVQPATPAVNHSFGTPFALQALDDGRPHGEKRKALQQDDRYPDSTDRGQRKRLRYDGNSYNFGAGFGSRH